MSKTTLVNGRIISSDSIIEGCVIIDGEYISYVGSPQGVHLGDNVIDVGGKYIIPGLVDVHVHFGLAGAQTLNLTKRIERDWHLDSRGAVHGGVTTVLAMLSTPESYLPLVEHLIPYGNVNSYTDYGFTVCILGLEHVEEMPRLFEMGIAGFKHFYTAFKGKAGEQIGLFNCNQETFISSLHTIHSLGDPAIAMVHAEDGDICGYYEEKVRNEGNISGLEAWAAARPSFAEFTRLNFAAALAYEIKAPIYFMHLSCHESVETLAAYKQRGARAYAEVVPHSLTMTQDMFPGVGVWGKFVPPFRDIDTTDVLWRALNSGVVEHINSDHCSYTRAEKEAGGGKYGSIWEVPPGISNVLEHMLPVLITRGVAEDRITLQKLVEVCCENNAKRFGLFPRKGVIRPGSDADIVVLDTDKPSIVDESFYHTRTPDISIHWGEKLLGIPQMTFRRGKLVMDRNQPNLPCEGAAFIKHNFAGSGS